VSITATALDIIKLSLKMAGVLAVSQTPSAEDANDALMLLNGMIASWQQNRWMIYHLVDISHQSSNQQYYTVGIGADFNVTRPDRLQDAYARLPQRIGNPNQYIVGNGSNPVDYPLSIMETYEEYAGIALKSLQSFPVVAFYDAALPYGKLYVWPIPNESFEVHLVIKETLQEFPTLTTQFALPPEYFEALLYNLTARIQMMYQLPVTPGVVALAKVAMNNISVANHRVGSLMMPSGLSRVGGGWPMHGVGGIYEGTFTLDESVVG
jgi:hypothetical protein